MLTAGLWVAAVRAAEVPKDGTQETVFGFSEVVHDAELRELVGKYDIRLSGVFISVAGMTGTHRLYPNDTMFDASAEHWLADARATAGEFFEKSLSGNSERLTRFIEGHRLSDIETSRHKIEELRSLLGIRLRLEDALRQLRAGAPVIYGVAVRGTAERVNKAASDPRVSERSDAMRAEGDARPARPTRPPEENEPSDPLQDASANDLYSAAVIIGGQR